MLFFPCGDAQHLFPHQTPGHFEAYPLMPFMANKVMLKHQTCADIQHWKLFLGSCSCYGYQSRGWPPSVVEVQSDYTVHCVKMSDRPRGCEVGVSFISSAEGSGIKVLWKKYISMLILPKCKATVFDFNVTSKGKKINCRLLFRKEKSTFCSDIIV